MKFITGIPNRGAGIGHAFVDWAKAFSLSKISGIPFLYSPFSGNNEHWDAVLGLGLNCPKYDQNSFDIILGPNDCTFEEYCNDKGHNCYSSVYVIDGNEYYQGISGLTSFENLARILRFHYLLARRKRPIYSPFKPGRIKIAIHIRRGNITEYEQFASRVLPNQYYYNALYCLLELLGSDEYDIIVVSNGLNQELRNLFSGLNARFVNTYSDIHDFHILASSDILITSASGFSYLASLINLYALKIVPSGFWHDWPKDSFLIDEIVTADFKSRLKELEEHKSSYRQRNSTYRESPRWDITTIRLDGEGIRTRRIDNASMRIRTFPSPGIQEIENEKVSRIHILSRKFLGAIIDCESLELHLAISPPRLDHIVDYQCAYIDYSLIDISTEKLRKDLMRFIARCFSEALMGRKILLPSGSCISVGEVLSSGFHSSISCLSIHSGTIFCPDLIAIKLSPSTSL